MNKDKTEFDTVQYDAAYPDGIEHHYWNVARNSIIRAFLKNQSLLEKKTLEIGCGRGYVVEDLRAHGVDCVGVDLAVIPSAKDYLFYGIDFTDLSDSLKKSVEVILLCDVLEHIVDTREFLTRVRNTFPSLKYILVTVPARKELWSNYDEYYGHITRYSQSLIVETLRHAGYRVVSLSYFFHALYIPARLLTLFKRERNIVVHSPKGI